MHLSELSVKRPVLATVLSALLVVVGLLCFFRLPVREYPDISPPIVSVETGYRGASALVVDAKITQLIEDRISGIEGIRTISSESMDGRSRITIEFELERDMDAAANDVRERVSRILSDLPEEADAPEIFKADSGGDVILWMNLASDRLDGLQLTDYAKRYIVERLSTAQGVARVRIGGAREYSMRIWLDTHRMAARGVTAGDIERALREGNVELPAGRVDSAERYFTVRTERLYRGEEDFANLVVQRGADGHLVRLSEIAEVRLGAVEHRQELRGNGQDMVGIGIVAQAKANTLEVSRAVKREVARIQESLPEGTRLFESYDRTVFVEESIREIYRSLGFALVMVVGVIFLFMGSVRAVLIPAVTVPISLVSSLIFLYYMGYSLNLLTLLALLLAIGLVVDDAIVVLENVYRRIHLGESPALAAVRGSRQVSFAVIATTLVLIAVFVPIGFLGGNMGRLFSEFAFAMAAGVGFSSVVALTLSPVMCSYLLSTSQTEGRLAQLVHRHLETFSRAYRRRLEGALRHPCLMALAVLLVVGVLLFCLRRLPSEFAPAEDRGAFFVAMAAPEGASYAYAQRYMREVEKELLPLVDSGEARRILVRTPRSFGDQNSFNSGFAIVALETWGQRRHVNAITREVSARLDRLAGVRASAIARGGLTQNAGEPVAFVIGGSTYEGLAQWRDLMLEALRSNPRLLHVEADYKETKPQLLVHVDKERAAELGVSVRQIAVTMETFFASRRVTTFLMEGEEYDVMLQGTGEDRSTPQDIDHLYVRSERTGELVPLGNLVRIEETAGAPVLNRFNRLRSLTLTAGLAEGYTLGEALEYLRDVVREQLPEDAQIDYKGESREYMDSRGALQFVFAMALVVVFLVLAAQFESVLHPLTILVTVPLAVMGALLGLWLTGGSLNIFSQIGIIMLIGLAAKNGILIVEFANQLRDEGTPFEEAILRAAELRLRPVAMTTLSTVFGALPLVLATGAGSESRATIGVVVFFGVLLASLLTLFVVPWVYSILGRLTQSPGARGMQIDREAREKPFQE